MPPSIFPTYSYTGITDQQETVLYHISMYSEGFLRFVSRKIRNFPSHGVDHSVRIIQLINHFTENWKIELTENERFMLYVAAWLHDIGCIRERDPHNLLSVEILMRDHNTCNYLDNIDSNLLRILRYIIESHSKSHCPYTLDKIPERIGSIRVRLLSAIFRLMDACEITKYKCPVQVFSEIRDDLKKPDGTPDTQAIEFWEGHMSISYLGFAKPNIDIFINDPVKTASIIAGLNEEIRSIQTVFRENGIEIPVIRTD
jgi:hypothetical protein